MLTLQSSLETNTKQGGLTISQVIPGFLKFGEFELSFRPATIRKYKASLKRIIALIGDIQITEFKYANVIELKEKISRAGGHEAHQAGIINALKSLLKYCSEHLELEVLEYKKVRPPKIKRREVIYLINEEIERFVESIPIWKSWNGKTPGKYLRMDALRFRTLVEVLLGTGMRISEALSLLREDIDYEKFEAKIIGKGGKERVVFFTQRSIEWIQFYLKSRTDDEKKLFITQRLTSLKTYDVSKLFATYRKKSGINKKITPHILRHSVATHLFKIS
jgi:integrase/recombinase XerD